MTDDELLTDELQTDELILTGRITTASNASFVGLIGDAAVVYKPIAGEQPLWDFPDGDLASREVGAYLVSEVFGGDIVPRTWLRDGPFGPGMVQLWQEADPEQDAVNLVAHTAVPSVGWREVFRGVDGDDSPVALIHEDSAPLRRMAVFDVIVNNADRKGAHILPMADGHRFGVDHGLTFHAEHKLRTVLWGWLGEKLTLDELTAVDRVQGAIDGPLGAALAELITADELDALEARCAALMRRRKFPAPRGPMPPMPWPLF